MPMTIDDLAERLMDEISFGAEIELQNLEGSLGLISHYRERRIKYASATYTLARDFWLASGSPLSLIDFYMSTPYAQAYRKDGCPITKLQDALIRLNLSDLAAAEHSWARWASAYA